MVVADIYVSTLYLLTTFALADILRTPILTNLEAGTLIQHGMLEFVTAFELCAICSELTIILERYGTLWYGIYLFITILWWQYRWTATACPFVTVENWIAGKTDFSTTIFLIACQLVGGSLYYKFYLKFLWGLEYGPGHADRLQQQECTSDIHVLVGIAAFIEGFTVFCGRFLAHMVSYVNFDNPVFPAIINGVIGVALVMAALNTTGGYMNPVLASALQYGCVGSTVMEHLAVYWIGDAIGAILAYFAWKYTEDALLKEKTS